MIPVDGLTVFCTPKRVFAPHATLVPQGSAITSHFIITYDNKGDTMEELPTAVNETDLLRIELGQERVARMAAQQDSLTLQLNELKVQFKKSQEELQALVSELSVKYQVSGNDTYDKVTGKITRQTPVP